ncbi:murein biosynthesis protein MurJ [Cephaloticoccus primus]|uniref:Probable lipid II flippase MurJ n=1 Tax=Cephaloticoccus primus TaxID=1548207 RepID=A0A139STG3_9BACT|nr:murein biosynthesis integral membrane protein MurJ [Cephaloticoccus primus]KXU37866.1 murein biosynthesis protein MurJ [Cephaloticoccus primus]
MSGKLKNIGVVSGLTVVSRVLGLMRDQLSAAVFGTSALNSAFITAFSLPNLFRRLLGEGALTAAFVPTLQEELAAGREPGAFRLLSQVASWLLLVAGGVVGMGMLGFAFGGRLPFLAGKWSLAAELTVLLFPYLVFVCLAAAFSATLNVFKRFTESALSPIWLNVAMIGTLGGAGLHFADSALGRMHWLCAGVLLGGLLQMLVPALVLMRLGWRPRFDLTLSPRVREIARLMAPGLFGVAIYQINIYVSRLLAFSVSDESAAVLFYANRLTELPIGVFAIAVATVVYPLLAQHAAQGQAGLFAEDYRKGLRLILLVNLPAAAGLALLAEPITRLLFERGSFTASDTALLVPLLAGFAVGMPFFSITSLSTRAFYALKDTKTPVKLAAVSFVINLGLSLALMRPLGALGLVLASTVAIIVQTVQLQRALTARSAGLRFAPLWGGVAKLAVAVLIMGAVVGAGWALLNGPRGVALAGTGFARDLLAVGGLIPLGVLIYGVALWALRIEGREQLPALWQRLRARSGAAARAPKENAGGGQS